MNDDELRELLKAAETRISMALDEMRARMIYQDTVLGFRLTALQFAVVNMARTHPSPGAFLSTFDQSVEHAIVDGLTRDYPEDLLERYRREFELLLGNLREACQGK